MSHSDFANHLTLSAPAVCVSASEILFRQTTSTTGQVTLVGAGPGDPEMLTFKAARAISLATVLLVDDLVNDEVLTHASGCDCSWHPTCFRTG